MQMQTLRTALLVAFQFPPFAGSSAVQRTLRFVRYLPQFGWRPLVLSAAPRAYDATSEDQLNDIAPSTVVHRAFALDTARHLGIRRVYPSVLALPDRWMSWRPFAIRDGLKLIRAYRPAVIWSTFPIPTAHLIAAALHERTGVPWIADFRDPMVQLNDPPDPRVWKAYEQVEQRTVRSADLNVFTTRATCELYRARYPELSSSSFAVVENGYDEEVFRGLSPAPRDRGVLLLHSGAIYPLERDPSKLFEALARLHQQSLIGRSNFCLRLRATGHDGPISALVRSFSLEAIVELAPPMPYRAALAEMLSADALVVLQAREVNTQVPAKIYEYLRAGRPVLALTHKQGATADVLQAAGIRTVAAINDAGEIERTLRELLAGLQTGTAPVPDQRYVANASRERRTAELAALFDRVSAEPAPRQSAR